MITHWLLDFMTLLFIVGIIYMQLRLERVICLIIAIQIPFKSKGKGVQKGKLNNFIFVRNCKFDTRVARNQYAVITHQIIDERSVKSRKTIVCVFYGPNREKCWIESSESILGCRINDLVNSLHWKIECHKFTNWLHASTSERSANSHTGKTHLKLRYVVSIWIVFIIGMEIISCSPTNWYKTAKLMIFNVCWYFWSASNPL